MQINRLEVKNYFALRDVSLEPGPLSVFIGPNGAGKTSLLDALVMLAACAERGLEEAISARGGMDMILNRGNAGAVSSARHFELRAEIKKAVGRVLSYEVQVRAKGGGYQVSREVLAASGTPRRKALTWIERSTSSAYERILDVLRAGFPDFTSLDFPLTAAGRATFLWKTRSHPEGLWPQQLSSGMRARLVQRSLTEPDTLGTGDRVTEHLMVSARRCPQLMALLETLREFSTLSGAGRT